MFMNTISCLVVAPRQQSPKKEIICVKSFLIFAISRTLLYNSLSFTNFQNDRIDMKALPKSLICLRNVMMLSLGMFMKNGWNKHCPHQSIIYVFEYSDLFDIAFEICILL